MRRTIAMVMLLLAPAAANALEEATPARALAGRVAGAPRTCISAFEADQGGQSFRSGDILYRGRGSTVYLNHPEGCPSLVPDRIIVSRTPQDRLCRGDIVDIVDQVARIGYGSCPLGDFVPYDRPRR